MLKHKAGADGKKYAKVDLLSAYSRSYYILGMIILLLEALLYHKICVRSELYNENQLYQIYSTTYKEKAPVCYECLI